MRKLISVILLLVLSIQLLPLKQTITWLLGGQATEELVHVDGKGKANDPANELAKHFLPVYSPALTDGLILSSSLLLPIHASELRRRHADDIPTPPPNS
jgi:hypothetical protein